MLSVSALMAAEVERHKLAPLSILLLGMALLVIPVGLIPLVGIILLILVSGTGASIFAKVERLKLAPLSLPLFDMTLLVIAVDLIPLVGIILLILFFGTCACLTIGYA